MSRLLQALQSGRVLLMDGGMGTELQRFGLKPGRFCEWWNLRHPGRVRTVHQAYVAAGAEVLLTNTFQAIPAAQKAFSRGSALLKEMDAEQWLSVFQGLAYTLCRSAVGRDGLVLADIGPFSSSTGLEYGEEKLLRRALTFPGPVDGILFETCSTRRAWNAVKKARKWSKELPILVSFTYLRTEDGDLQTLSNHDPEWVAEQARAHDIAALGVNCGRDIGMDEIIEIVRRYRQITDLPLFARPNAGTPKQRGSKWVYPLRPEQLAERLPELLEAGVAMLGGCCGTTPEHVAAMREVVDRWNADSASREA